MDKKMMTIDLNSKVLLDKAERDGVETMYDRKQNFKAQCGFGLQGNCCRICGMGPCRITPKTPRGLCGADEHVIVGRNFARMVAGGTAAHSDHARDIACLLYTSDILELKKDINKNIDKEDNVVMFVYDDKKIFEKSKAYRVSI